MGEVLEGVVLSCQRAQCVPAGQQHHAPSPSIPHREPGRHAEGFEQLVRFGDATADHEDLDLQLRAERDIARQARSRRSPADLAAEADRIVEGAVQLEQVCELAGCLEVDPELVGPSGLPHGLPKDLDGGAAATEVPERVGLLPQCLAHEVVGRYRVSDIERSPSEAECRGVSADAASVEAGRKKSLRELAGGDVAGQGDGPVEGLLTAHEARNVDPAATDLGVHTSWLPGGRHRARAGRRPPEQAVHPPGYVLACQDMGREPVEVCLLETGPRGGVGHASPEPRARPKWFAAAAAPYCLPAAPAQTEASSASGQSSAFSACRARAAPYCQRRSLEPDSARPRRACAWRRAL